MGSGKGRHCWRKPAPPSFGGMGVSAAVVAATPRRRAKARRKAAPTHVYASRGAAAVPWASNVGRKDRVSAVPMGLASPNRGRSRYYRFPIIFWATCTPAAAVATNLRRRAKARREAAFAHVYTSRGAAAVPWADRVGSAAATSGARLAKLQLASDYCF
jgi:hypothetical protein